MTSAPEPLTVQCPSCGVQFEAWRRPAANQDLDGFDDAAWVEQASSATCPACGTATELDRLFVQDGVLHFPNE
jgi:endogenous inhibitor of DNA gyrase (YacG/DUF329 family)